MVHNITGQWTCEIDHDDTSYDAIMAAVVETPAYESAFAVEDNLVRGKVITSSEGWETTYNKQHPAGLLLYGKIISERM